MRLACLLVLLATPALADKVTLARSGELVLDGASFPVEYDEAVGPANTKLSMVSLGGKRRGVMLVTARTEGDDDPPPRHQGAASRRSPAVPIRRSRTAPRTAAIT